MHIAQEPSQSRSYKCKLTFREI